MATFLAELKRYWYTLTLAWQHRLEMRHFFKKKPPFAITSLCAMDPQEWVNQGIRVLILDFDGVLSPHAAKTPLPAVIIWLRDVVKIFDGQVYVLTNLPTESRRQWFAEAFPQITFIQAPRKKPYPEAVESVLRQTQVDPKQVLLVDDRLLTGIILAVSTGIQGCWVTEPYADFKHRPFVEAYFWLLRRVDQICLKLMLIV